LRAATQVVCDPETCAQNAHQSRRKGLTPGATSEVAAPTAASVSRPRGRPTQCQPLPARYRTEPTRSPRIRVRARTQRKQVLLSLCGPSVDRQQRSARHMLLPSSMIGVNLLQRVPRARYPRSAVGRRRSCGVCLGLQPPTASAKQGDFGLEDRAEELPERPLPAAAKVAERIRKRRRRLFTQVEHL